MSTPDEKPKARGMSKRVYIDKLRHAFDDLAAIVQDIHATNPRMRPIQTHTKTVWANRVSSVAHDIWMLCATDEEKEEVNSISSVG